MERRVFTSRISRVDSRYRRWAQDGSRGGAAQRPGVEKEEESLQDDVDEPLLIREQKGRAVMGKAHKLFHRRAAQASSNVLTISVQVFATLDASGNVIGQETVTPSLPTVPAVPSAPLPTVPAVPAFPSDLTVPAYPWPSGVPSAQAISSTPLTSAPFPTTASITPTAFPSISGFNSTTSSSIISSSTFSSSLNRTTTSSSSRSSTRSSTSSTRSSTSSTSTTSSATSSAAASSAAGGGGGYNPANTTPPPAASTTAASNASSDNSSPLGTPEVVGTVFGSLAGAALLLALILFLIRRHKQQQAPGVVQLTGDDNTDNQPMTQTAARSSFVTPSFLNRFSGASRSTAESSAGTGERGFQRISGRKLPSAFSEGMTSEQFARGEGTFSGSSFYQDDKGVYGGPGVIPKDFGKETGEASNTGAVGVKERVMPSPARTPIIHHSDDAPPFGTSRNGGGAALSPPHTPNNPDFPPRATLGRSHPSHDGSRSSRFTENV